MVEHWAFGLDTRLQYMPHAGKLSIVCTVWIVAKPETVNTMKLVAFAAFPGNHFWHFVLTDDLAPGNAHEFVKQHLRWH